MSEAWLECQACHSQYPIGPMFSGCPTCQKAGRIHPLEVAYGQRPNSLALSPGSGIWRWSDWLPPLQPAHKVSLGEGLTPLLPLEVEGVRLLLKNETVNPTWSWKDRPNVVSVSMAKAFGFSEVVAISTGNHGSAAAAYAARAGMDCLVLCHQDAPALQLALMKSYGANVVRGGDRDALAEQRLSKGGAFPCMVLCPRTGVANPYGVEGFKTIALEIVKDLGHAPDLVFIPVGSGDGIYGIWKGFRELLEAGVIERPPRMIACQSTGADSAVRAFQRNSFHVEPVEASTVALSLSEDIVGGHAMRAIFESKGQAIAIDDSRIVAARRLASRLGFAIEAASATALACAIQFAESNEQGTWVVIGSGSGVKWPDQLIAAEA